MQWFSCKKTLAKFEDRASQSKPQFISEIECRDHFEVYSIGSNSSKNHIIDSVEADILFPQSKYASYSFDYHININGDDDSPVEKQMEAFAADLGEEHELPTSAVQKFLLGEKMSFFCGSQNGVALSRHRFIFTPQNGMAG